MDEKIMKLRLQIAILEIAKFFKNEENRKIIKDISDLLSK